MLYCRSVEVSSHIKAQKESLQGETSLRKTNHPASSVVQVNKSPDEAQDSNILYEKGNDEKDKDPGSRRVYSCVSLPRKPECKPSLHPTKRAKRKLNVKTTSKSMGSVTKKKGSQKLPQKPERKIKSKEHCVDFRNKIVLRHISGEG
ncbi:zinc finger CCCH domain-containing protein 14-like [Hypomesus transpacificus]|uniref:zinc finger CCCH domain-containing protein 14-like n=1 Tax=Hypomesus transpacificus TaxID=137520 RepID=UPI001F081131|nr:zinc finger CCCH domain-containing protein 14-like [Hypomesus transpacificus]